MAIHFSFTVHAELLYGYATTRQSETGLFGGRDGRNNQCVDWLEVIRQTLLGFAQDCDDRLRSASESLEYLWLFSSPERICHIRCRLLLWLDPAYHRRLLSRSCSCRDGHESPLEVELAQRTSFAVARTLRGNVSAKPEVPEFVDERSFINEQHVVHQFAGRVAEESVRDTVASQSFVRVRS